METIEVTKNHEVVRTATLEWGRRQTLRLAEGESIEHPTRLDARIGGPAVLSIIAFADGGVEVTEFDPKRGSNPDGSTSPADVIRIAQEVRKRGE